MYKSEMGIGQGNSQYGPPVLKIAQEGPYKLLDKYRAFREHSQMECGWALSKIVQCKTNLNKQLIPAIEAIEKREEDNDIKKIYKQG